MRHLLLVSVLLVLTVALLGPAAAGDDDPSHARRDAKRREGERQLQLQIALVRADTNQKRAEHLMRFVEQLLGELAQARTAETPSVAVLEQQNESLHAQIEELQENLRAEQKQHATDVGLLHQELAKANERIENGRLALTRAQQAQAVAEEQQRAQKQEVERLRWVYAKEAPRESVARALTNIPASHWRSELLNGSELRARVALQVLAVLSDPSPELVGAILHAVSGHRSLLDTAVRPLVRIGAPAVRPLVAVGCGEEGSVVLDRGWLMHVLGTMGPVAKDALPWLEEIAAGRGRKADQAARAIQRIRVK